MKVKRALSLAPLAVFFLLAGTVAFPVGMRTDVAEKTYRAAAANEGKFKPGETTPDFSATCGFVGEDKRDKGLAYGSGVLISSNLVLTAAHVVLDMDRPNRFDMSGKIVFGANLKEPSSTHRITRVQLPEVWKSTALRQTLLGMRRSKNENTASFNDIALVTINPPCTNRPAVLLNKLPELGETVWFAGYGECDAGRKKVTGDAAYARHAGQNILDRIVTGGDFDGGKKKKKAAPAGGGSLFCDFDNGTDEYNRLQLAKAKRHLKICGVGKSEPRQLPLEASCHQGDSGGPMFANIDGDWKLVGICSYVFEMGGPRKRSAFQYGEILSYTSVGSFVEWIEDCQEP